MKIDSLIVIHIYMYVHALVLCYPEFLLPSSYILFCIKHEKFTHALIWTDLKSNDDITWLICIPLFPPNNCYSNLAFFLVFTIPFSGMIDI